MVRLRASDIERVARFSAELAAAEEAQPFPPRLVELFRLLVGSESAGYCELDRIDRRDLAVVSAPEPDGDEHDDQAEAEVYWRLRHQYPTCVYEDETGDFSSRKLSDFITLQELHRREIYADFFRPQGIEYEIGVGISAPLTHTKVFSFANGKSGGDFAERERTILDLLRPILTLRYRQIEARRRADTAVIALETSDEALVLLNNAGKAEFATPRALRLLAGNGLTLKDIPRIEPLLAHAVRPGVLVLSEPRPFGLTNREREILSLVAEGRTNAEVATALWISPNSPKTPRKRIHKARGHHPNRSRPLRARTSDHRVIARRSLPSASAPE